MFKKAGSRRPRNHYYLGHSRQGIHFPWWPSRRILWLVQKGQCHNWYNTNPHLYERFLVIGESAPFTNESAYIWRLSGSLFEPTNIHSCVTSPYVATLGSVKTISWMGFSCLLLLEQTELESRKRAVVAWETGTGHSSTDHDNMVATIVYQLRGCRVFSCFDSSRWGRSISWMGKASQTHTCLDTQQRRGAAQLPSGDGQQRQSWTVAKQSFKRSEEARCTDSNRRGWLQNGLWPNSQQKQQQKPNQTNNQIKAVVATSQVVAVMTVAKASYTNCCSEGWRHPKLRPLSCKVSYLERLRNSTGTITIVKLTVPVNRATQELYIRH